MKLLGAGLLAAQNDVRHRGQWPQSRIASSARAMKDNRREARRDLPDPSAQSSPPAVPPASTPHRIPGRETPARAGPADRDCGPRTRASGYATSDDVGDRTAPRRLRSAATASRRLQHARIERVTTFDYDPARRIATVSDRSPGRRHWCRSDRYGPGRRWPRGGAGSARRMQSSVSSLCQMSDARRSRCRPALPHPRLAPSRAIGAGREQHQLRVPGQEPRRGQAPGVDCGHPRPGFGGKLHSGLPAPDADLRGDSDAARA